MALRTVQRWVARYRQDGLIGLAPKARRDRGQHHLAPELQALIEGLALRKPRLSAAMVARQVREVAEAQGWSVPSYSTVYAVMHALDPALVMLAQDGAKVYGDRFDLLYRWEATRPNEIWQADHTPLDIWVMQETGQLARPWLTVILDDYSRAVAGFRVGFDPPSILRTALTLRQAIGPKDVPGWSVCGIPERFYTDHGVDFTSQHLEQVAAQLKMRLIFSNIGVPRGRGQIERFFETVNQLCLSELPGYVPANSPRGTPRPSWVLTLAMLEQHLQTFFVETYHRRVHSETGVAPQARWEEQQFLPRLPDALDQLDLLLLTLPTTRRVRPDGIRFANLRYLDVTLAGYIGEDVVIRYDPRDLAEIRVYHDDQFVCRAVCQALAGQTLSLEAIVHARKIRRRELRGHIVARVNIADQLRPLPRFRHRAKSTTPSSSPEASPPLKRYVND